MNRILSVVGIVYEWYVAMLEKRIGYRVEFQEIPNVWINAVVRFNMGPSWARHGIRARGINHWTIGSISNGVSTRYVRDAKQYQSWLGCYLVKFQEQKDFTIQDHFDLAVADQLNWLRDLGDPDPYIELPARNIGASEDMRIGEFSGMLYQYRGGFSHSDVGTQSKRVYAKLLMRAAAALLNVDNSALCVSGKSLLPDNIHAEYEMVILRGYVAIIELERDTKVVLYGNGAALLDAHKAEQHDHWPFLRDDILKAFRSVQIHKL